MSRALEDLLLRDRAEIFGRHQEGAMRSDVFACKCTTKDGVKVWCVSCVPPSAIGLAVKEGRK